MSTQTAQMPSQPSNPSDEDIVARVKDQRLLVMVDRFLVDIGVDRNVVPLSELTDFALDLRNEITKGSAE